MSLEPPTRLFDSLPDAALQVFLLGTIEFDAALVLQRHLAFQVASDRTKAGLILCEHPPLITVGREGSRAHIDLEPDELQVRGWSVRWVNRGGGCLLHLPGQLAIYPILPLDYLGIGLHSYLARLQGMLAGVAAEFNVVGQIRKNHPGVWVRQRLLAEVGVAIRDWVCYFGAFLNINPNLALLRPLRTGLPGGGLMTSLERERRGPMRPSQVRERIVEHFLACFPYGRTALFSHHPVLDRRSLPGPAFATRR